jgi:hypothetical protein
MHKVKQASDFVLGLDYPYWYNLGQIEAETNCAWKTSLDGWGSIGYAQLTEKFLPWLKEKFPNWKIQGHIDHFMAQAYLIKQLLDQVVCKKLWCVYQCYNRSCWKIGKPKSQNVNGIKLLIYARKNIQKIFAYGKKKVNAYNGRQVVILIIITG